MPDSTIHAVTGAYGFSGKYIAQRLLDALALAANRTCISHRPRASFLWQSDEKIDRIERRSYCHANLIRSTERNRT